MKLYCFFNKDKLLTYEYCSYNENDLSNVILKIKKEYKVKNVDLVIFVDDEIPQFLIQNRFKSLKEFIITKEKLILRQAASVFEENIIKTKQKS
jgi:hypothetical protein